MVANVRGIVAGAAGSLMRRNAAGNQTTGRNVVVDSRYSADGNLQDVEELLAPGNGAPRGALIAVTDLFPCVVQVENIGCKMPVPRRHQPTRLFESGKQ